MKKFVIPLLVCLLVLSGCSEFSDQQEAPESSSQETTEAGYDNNPTLSNALDITPTVISFERTASYRKDENGNILAEMYFDKPVLAGNSVVICKINTIFDIECQGFFYGSEESKFFKTGHYDYFFESVRSVRERYGDAAVAQQPLECTNDAEIVYQSNELICFKLSGYWMAGGVSDHSYYGYAFNLTTGELLQISSLIDVSINIFNKNVTDMLCNNYAQYDIPFLRSDIENTYKAYRLDDYNYYYDGSDIYLIFSQDQYYNDSYILKYTG